METIKSFIPLITFFIGMICTPYVEGLKEKRALRILKRNMWTELEDELTSLEDSIKKTDLSISKRKNLADSAIYLSLPPKVDFLLLNEDLKLFYADLTTEQRLSIKNVIRLQNSINENYDVVLENYQKSNLTSLSAEKSMLYSKLSLYLLLTYLTETKENYTRPKSSNDELAVQAAKALNVKNIPSPTN